ncbi:MAG: hypothetical protein QM811_11230 [Pirellulales bacterium]
MEPVLDRAIDFLLDHIEESGFINNGAIPTHGPMYGHGFATLFLSECYGMTRRDDLREKLSKAVRLIVTTQNPEGGWRYQPQRDDADISVTICQIMALRCAERGLVCPDRNGHAVRRVRQKMSARRRRVHLPTDARRHRRVPTFCGRRRRAAQRRHL